MRTRRDTLIATIRTIGISHVHESHRWHQLMGAVAICIGTTRIVKRVVALGYRGAIRIGAQVEVNRNSLIEARPEVGELMTKITQVDDVRATTASMTLRNLGVDVKAEIIRLHRLS